MTDLLQFESGSSTLLCGSEIADATLAEIEASRTRLWGCYFITSIGLSSDPHQLVRQIAQSLVRATRRGVDVRLLIDDFEADDGYQINHVAYRYLTERGVPVRAYRSERHHSTHSKYLLVDDGTQIVGSGNLSHGGLTANLEMAVRVESPDLLRWLGDRFILSWDRSNPSEVSP